MFFTSLRRPRMKRCVPVITALAFVGSLSMPARLLAQTPPDNKDTQISDNGSDTTKVYSWQDMPQGQKVKVSLVSFDQTGYHLTSQKGDTILVPFDRQNLNVMRFGNSTTGQPYLVNEGDAPSLYVPANFNLQNAQNADVYWQPLPNDYMDSQPIYVSPVPTMADYANLNFYPKMTIYGGVWGYTTVRSVNWTRGYYISIDGRRFTNYLSYETYYINHPGTRFFTSPVNGGISGSPGQYIQQNGTRIYTNVSVPNAPYPSNSSNSRVAAPSAPPVPSSSRATGTLGSSTPRSDRSAGISNPPPPRNDPAPGISNPPPPPKRSPPPPPKRRPGVPSPR